MKQIKVSDLKNEQLAEWTARAQEWVYKETPDDLEYLGCGSWYTKNGTFLHIKRNYRPDINSAQAMELLEHDEIVGFWTYMEEGKTVYCVEYGNEERWAQGATLKIAVCRAVIASVYGEYVPVED